MALKAKEQAVVDLVINGAQAKASLKELTGAYNALFSEVSKMKKEDDPQLYAKKVALLKNLKVARDAERDSVMGVKKAQEDLNKAEQVNPNAGLLSKLQDQITGNSTVSKLFGTLTAGYQAIVGVGAQAQEIITGVTTTVKVHREALAEVRTELTVLKDAMAANIAEQELMEQALLATTTEEEANIIVTKQQKLAQEENTIATKLQALAYTEATLATEGTTVAMKVLRIALATTGIGLLIIAVASLVAYFEQSNEGAKKFQVIMAQLNAIFQQFMKALAPIGKALYDTFAESKGPLELFGALLRQAVLPLATLVKLISDIKTGNFKQAFIDAGQAFNQWGNNVRDTLHGAVVTAVDLSKNLNDAAGKIDLTATGFKNAAMQAKAVTVARQELTKAERLWSEEKIKQQGEVELLTKKLRDQNISEADRSKLADQAIAIRTQIFNKDLEYANKNKDLVQQEQDLNSKKDYQAITDAKNRVQELINQKDLEIQGITNRQSRLDAKQQAAQAKAAKALEKYNKDLENVQSEYLAVAQKAADNSLDGLDAQIKVIDDKFAKLVAKLKKLASDPNTSKAIAAQLNAEIQDITKAGGLSDQEKAKATKAQQDKYIKTGTDRKKISDGFSSGFENVLNNGFDQQSADLKDEEAAELELANSEEAKMAIKDKYNTKELDLEKAHLNALKQLRESFGKDTTAQNKKLSENELKIQADTYAKKQKTEAEDYQFAKNLTNGVADLIQLTMGNSSMGVALQKTIAVSQIAIDTAQAISAAVKTGAYVGLTPIEKAIAIAGNIAVVLANIVKAKSELSGAADVKPGQVKKAAKGGVFNGPSHADGGLDVVDTRTGKPVVNVEGGEPFMVLSKETRKNNGALINQLLFNSMYRNGATVDVAGVSGGISMARNGGVYSKSSYTNDPTVDQVDDRAYNQASGGNTARLDRIEAAIENLHGIVKKEALKPVVLSRRVMDQDDTKQVALTRAVNA